MLMLRPCGKQSFYVLTSDQAQIKGHIQLIENHEREMVSLDFLKRQIRYEVVTAAYGVETAYQVLLDTDQQVQKALAEIPKAKTMAEDVRRQRTATR